MTMYRVFRALAAAIFKFLNFYRVSGRENIPSGGVLVCANHTNLSDPVFVGLALDTKVRMRFMAKIELFRSKLLGWFLGKLGVFPVNRGAPDLSAIKTALKTLASGERLVMFPEGTRNSDEGAKAGAGMLALRSGRPILPIYITPGKKAFRRVNVVIGKPYYPDKPEGKPTQEDYHRIADDCLEKIKALGESVRK